MQLLASCGQVLSSLRNFTQNALTVSVTQLTSLKWRERWRVYNYIGNNNQQISAALPQPQLFEVCYCFYCDLISLKWLYKHKSLNLSRYKTDLQNIHVNYSVQGTKLPRMDFLFKAKTQPDLQTRCLGKNWVLIQEVVGFWMKPSVSFSCLPTLWLTLLHKLNNSSLLTHDYRFLTVASWVGWGSGIIRPWNHK